MMKQLTKTSGKIGILFAVCVLLLFAFPTGHAHADNFPFVGTLHAGNSPEAMAVDEQTHMLYIGYESPGGVVGFDPISGKVRWSRRLSDVVTDVQVDSTSHRVYAAISGFRNGTSGISVLDGATGQLVFTAPVESGDNGITLDAKRQRAYTANPDSHVVTQLSFVTGWQSGPVSVQTTQLHIGFHPQALGVNSQTGRLYVADAADHMMRVVDEDTGNVLATIEIGEVPLHPIRVDEKTGRIYVVCSTSQEVDVIDGKTNHVLAHIPASPYPEGIAMNTATERIYVANEGSKENGSGPHDTGTAITVIDGQSFAVLGTLNVGRAPDGIEADPALHRIYVAVEDNNAVVEVADRPDLPLTSVATLYRAEAAQRAISLLQQAAIITAVLMLLTLIGATLVALSPRWHGQETPQTQLADASSRSEKHTLPL